MHLKYLLKYTDLPVIDVALPWRKLWLLLECQVSPSLRLFEMLFDYHHVLVDFFCTHGEMMHGQRWNRVAIKQRREILNILIPPMSFFKSQIKEFLPKELSIWDTSLEFLCLFGIVLQVKYNVFAKLTCLRDITFWSKAGAECSDCSLITWWSAGINQEQHPNGHV